MENINHNPSLNPSPFENSVVAHPVHNQKQSFLLIKGLAVILVVIVVGGFFLYQKMQTKNAPAINENTSTNKSTQSQQAVFQTLQIIDTDLNDGESFLYFTDANKIYKKDFGGSSSQEVATLPHNIDSMSILSNGTLLINTDKSKFGKVVNKQLGDADYKQTVVEYGFWLLKPDSNIPEQIEEQEYKTLTRLKDNKSSERIYTKEYPNGQAEVLLDKLDGSAPTKIGLLTQKIISLGCEIEPCPGKKHPGEFYPSLDGSYLLNKPPGGGGLGESAVVISRDGGKVYKINFYWYVSSAIWVGNDKLLTKGQDGKQKLITFQEDGSFSESLFQKDLSGYFGQENLSPSGKLLFVTDLDKQISLYDLEENKTVQVETLNEAQVRRELTLLPEEIIENRYIFLGWNKNSDKVLFAVTTGAISGAHNNDRTIIREIKVYDVKSGKVYTVAKLNPNPTNPYDYSINGKPKATINNFAIR